MPEERLPAVADRAAWEKITKRRAGTRWDNVVEQIWKGLGRDQDEVLSIEKFDGYKTKGNNRAEKRERLALMNMAIEEKHLEIYGG